MTNRQTQRAFHSVGNYEKTMYKRRFAENVSLGRTAGDSVDIKRTEESSSREKGRKQEKIQGRRKSTKLKMKQFVEKNILSAIISTLTAGLIWGYINISIEQGIQKKDMSNISSKIDDLNMSNSNEMNNYNDLNVSLNVFKAETAKDFEYIKKQMDILSNK